MIFILFSPEIGAFYASLFGQVVMIGVLGASVLIYALGVRAASGKMRLSQSSGAGFGGGMAEGEGQGPPSLVVGYCDQAPLFEQASPQAEGRLPESERSSEGLTKRDFLS